MDIDKDSAQVCIPPPLMLLACILVGVGLHYIYPLHLFPEDLRILGGLLITAGVLTILYCAGVFRKFGVDIKPWKATSQLITTGIYRFSRNPIYLSFTFIILGFALALNNLWIALMMVPLVLVINRYVIGKEEAYLESKFGTEYLAYKKQTRRWL